MHGNRTVERRESKKEGERSRTMTSGGSRGGGGSMGSMDPPFKQKKNFFQSKIEVNAVILYVGSHLRLRLGLGRGDLADES